MYIDNVSIRQAGSSRIERANRHNVRSPVCHTNPAFLGSGCSKFSTMDLRYGASPNSHGQNHKFEHNLSTIATASRYAMAQSISGVSLASPFSQYPYRQTKIGHGLLLLTAFILSNCWCGQPPRWPAPQKFHPASYEKKLLDVTSAFPLRCLAFDWDAE